MAEFIANNEDEWQLQEDNKEWLEAFQDSLGPEYWSYKNKADIERLIDELTGGEY